MSGYASQEPEVLLKGEVPGYICTNADNAAAHSALKALEEEQQAMPQESIIRRLHDLTTHGNGSHVAEYYLGKFAALTHDGSVENLLAAYDIGTVE